jgi:Na+/melibiose symporter-like transporter
MRRLFLAALLTFGAALPLLSLVGDLPGLGHQPFIGRWLQPLVEGVLAGHAPRVEYLHAGAVFVVIAAPVSVFMVLPHALLAEIIDEDERRTGYRREAMYNGVEGLLTTMGWGAAFLLNGGLLRAWDVKQHETLGVLMVFPVAGAFMLVAGAVFRRYPLGRPAASLEAGR